MVKNRLDIFSQKFIRQQMNLIFPENTAITNKKMGGKPGKISDEQKIKLYRRVSLIEARKRFERLGEAGYLLIYVSKFPVSRNFTTISYPPNLQHKALIDIVQLDFEIVGHNPEKYEPHSSLLNLLNRQIDADVVLEGLVIGLNKEQYDLLFSTN